MAKKKASPVVYYTPPIAVQEVKDIINDKLDQIPPYEDGGIRYQGKYKIQKSNNEYELRTQTPRNIYFDDGGGVTGFTTRPNSSTTDLYVKEIIISYVCDLAVAVADFKEIILYDGYYVIGGVLPVFKIYIPRVTTNNKQFLSIPLEVPFVIKTDKIGYDFGSSPIGSNEFIGITLVGWEQQKN